MALASPVTPLDGARRSSCSNAAILRAGTSSASTKLIHGGLRYLEHYEFAALVRESLIERERLWAIAPHIIWPLRFVLPHQKGIRPAWLVRLGAVSCMTISVGAKSLPARAASDLKPNRRANRFKPGIHKGVRIFGLLGR